MLIPIDVGAAVESKPVPNGWYDMQITESTDGNSKGGKPMMTLDIAIQGHETAPAVRHFVSWPVPGEDAKKTNYKSLMVKRLLNMLKVPYPGAQLDTEKLAMSLVGISFKGELHLSEPDEGGRVYNRLQVPYLSDEAGGGKQAVPLPPKR